MMLYSMTLGDVLEGVGEAGDVVSWQMKDHDVQGLESGLQVA
jgi:hypothetical protein